MTQISDKIKSLYRQGWCENLRTWVKTDNHESCVALRILQAMQLPINVGDRMYNIAKSRTEKAKASLSGYHPYYLKIIDHSWYSGTKGTVQDEKQVKTGMEL